MSLLLTREEYESISQSIELPSGAFIDGHARHAASGETFETLNPANGQVLNRIAACGQADIDLAVEKAREEFEDGRWARMHPTQRNQAMIKWCKLIRRHRRELAVLESVESGKPIQEIENVDLAETPHCAEDKRLISGG